MSEVKIINQNETLPVCKHCGSEGVIKFGTYKAYTDWSVANGDKYFLGKGNFNARITEKGFVRVPGRQNKKVWRGLRLLTNDEKVTMVTLVSNFPINSPIKEDIGKDREKQVTKVTKVTNPTLNLPENEGFIKRWCFW